MRRGRGRYLDGTAHAGRVAQTSMRSFVKSIQTGSISISGTTGTATINAVDLNNAILIPGGLSSAGVTSTTEDHFGYLLTFTNSTTITLDTVTAPAGANIIAYFTVIEYYPGFIKSVQRGTISSSATPATATITTVDTTKSIVMHLGHKDADTAGAVPGTNLAGLQLTNATTVTRVAQTGGFTNVTGYQVVEYY